MKFPRDPNLVSRDETVRADYQKQAKAALDRRAAANTPWTEKKEESGERELIRCNLPIAKTFQSFRSHKLRLALCSIAGGYTRYKGEGGWQSEDRPILEEIWIWEVSVADPETREKVIALFQEYGRDTGQEWTHITVTREDARHTKTS